MQSSQEPPFVKATGLTKIFKDFWFRPRVVALDNLDLSILPGEVHGLLALGQPLVGGARPKNTLLDMCHYVQRRRPLWRRGEPLPRRSKRRSMRRRVSFVSTIWRGVLMVCAPAVAELIGIN